MKKLRSGIMALVIGLSITFTVSAEITVPDEVKKMSGEEGYRKGYEDALKASFIPVKTEYEINEYVPFQEFEVKITGAERITSAKSNTPAVKIYYSFKNLKDEETSPLNGPEFTVYQNLVEMDRLLESGKEGNFMLKSVKKGGEMDKCFTIFALDNDSRDLIVDIYPWKDKRDKKSVILQLQ